MCKFSALKHFALRFAIGRGMSSEHGEFIGKLGVLEMQVLELSIDSTSATEKVSAHVGFYTKNGVFHPLIPPPTTELKIR